MLGRVDGREVLGRADGRVEGRDVLGRLDGLDVLGRLYERLRLIDGLRLAPPLGRDMPPRDPPPPRPRA
ncbi:MAG: hypothetical protein IID44_24705 [Planctomycetes bacterium]|nr:hypothetical protein [Planctomycetota bacterium]